MNFTIRSRTLLKLSLFMANVSKSQGYELRYCSEEELIIYLAWDSQPNEQVLIFNSTA